MLKKSLILSVGAALICVSAYLAFFENASEMVYGAFIVAGLSSIVFASMVHVEKKQSILEALSEVDPFKVKIAGWAIAIFVAICYQSKALQAILIATVLIGGTALGAILLIAKSDRKSQGGSQ